MSAGNVVGNDNIVADSQRGYRTSNLGDVSHRLMTHFPRRTSPLISMVHVEVRSTKRRGCDADNGVRLVLYDGDRQVRNIDLIWNAIIHDSAHRSVERHDGRSFESKQKVQKSDEPVQKDLDQGSLDDSTIILILFAPSRVFFGDWRTSKVLVVLSPERTWRWRLCTRRHMQERGPLTALTGNIVHSQLLSGLSARLTRKEEMQMHCDATRQGLFTSGCVTGEKQVKKKHEIGSVGQHTLRLLSRRSPRKNSGCEEKLRLKDLDPYFDIDTIDSAASF